MIYTEDTRIKLGGALLPGLIKKLEIKGEALIEEVEVEGSKTKPKQGIGYEDCKVSIELIIDSTENETALRKIERLKAIFRKGSQSKPQPLSIVCPETSAAGVNKVLFKSLSYTLTNKADQYAVQLEFWEYVPMTISAVSSKSGATPPLSQDYQYYLIGNQGSAPKQPDKTAGSPAREVAAPRYPSFITGGMLRDGFVLP